MSGAPSLSDSVSLADELLPESPSLGSCSAPSTPLRVASSPTPPSAQREQPSPASASSSVEQKSKLLRFDLGMDLLLLTQCRIHPHLFVRGSPDMQHLAEELGEEEKFAGISKKAVRDRLMKLIDQHKSNDNWRKRQTGSEEAYSAKEQLLTELVAMQREKDVPPPGQQNAKADRQLALQLRNDALTTLGGKHAAAEKEPEAKRRCGSTTEAIVQFLEVKDEREQKTEEGKLALGRDKLRVEETELQMRVRQQEMNAENRTKQEENAKEERKLASDKIELEKMRVRLQERELEERLVTQRAEVAMRQKREEDDRTERRDFMQMMATIVSNLQNK